MTAVETPQQQYDREWLRRVEHLGVATQHVISAATAGRLNGRQYGIFLDAVHALRRCHNEFTARGCRPVELADDEQLNAVYAVAEGLRRVQDLLPPTAPRMHFSLIRQLVSELALTLQKNLETR